MAENQNQSCRRASPREEVTLAGSAFGLGRSRSIIVSDLSADGARLDARDMPAPGEDVLVVIGAFDGLATVAWRNDDRCGVRFDEPLPDYMLSHMKSDAKWMEVAGWYR
jgi:hypothetical protein